MKMNEEEIRLRRFRILAKARALHEAVIVNLGELHGAVLTGLGNEAAPVGVLLAMMESMDEQTFLFSAKCGDQRSQMPIAAVTDEIIKSDHDHSYMMLRNHLHRKGVEDGNVHWGCLEHGIYEFYTSDMMRHFSTTTGGAWETRRYLAKPVGVYFFGEGASSQGVAHEVMRWIRAQNYKRDTGQLAKYGATLSEKARESGVLRPVPMIAVLQINRWSIYTDEIDEHGMTSEIRQDGKSDFARWAESYKIRGVDVIDSDDLESVIHHAKEAIRCAQNPAPRSTLLVLHMDGRRTAHNEHQIDRPKEARENRDWSKGKIEGIDSAEFAELWSNEPLERYKKYLVDSAMATEEELAGIIDEEERLMDERWERAFNEPEATFEDSIKDRSLFLPHEWTLPLERPESESQGTKMTTDRAMLWVLDELLSEDEGVVYCGEDVGSGGVLLPTRRLQRKFGPERVFDIPISEEAMLGTTAGASLARWLLRKHGIVKTIGTKICEAQFMPFNGNYEVLMRSISPNPYQKGMPFSFITIEHYGVVHGGGSGPQHSADESGHYLQTPGIAVVCPSNAYDLVGLMRAAYECGWPVVFMSSIWSYGEPECAREIPEEKYLIPIGKAEVKREGKDISVITYGNCVNAALREAEFLAKDGIDLEVVDLRSLQPLDMDTIGESIKKTGRAVVMSEASPMVSELMIGRIVSNFKLCDALSRTPKSMEGTEKIFKEFRGTDFETYNRAPRIMRLSREWTPVAGPKNIEWQDLPFEQYTRTVLERDEDGEYEEDTTALRAVRLSVIAHELMRY